MGYYDANGQWQDDAGSPPDAGARPLVLSSQQQAEIDQANYRAAAAANPPPPAIPTPIGTIPSTESLGGPAAIAGNPNMPPPGAMNGAYSPLAPVVGVAPAAPAVPAVAAPGAAPPPMAHAHPAHAAGPHAVAPPPILGQEAADATAAKDIARRQGASATDAAKANSDAANDAVTLGADQAKESEVFNQAKDQYLKERADRLEADTEKLANQPVSSYWSRLSAGQRIESSLFFALGGSGAALQAAGTGKVVENPAIAQFDKNVQDDLQIQRTQFEQSKDILALRKSNLDEAKQLYAIKSDQLAAKQAAALTQLKSVATARLKMLGMNDAQIAQDATVQTIDQNLHKLQFDTSREIVKDADAHAQSKAAVAASYAAANASKAHAEYEKAAAGAKAKAGQGFPVRDPSTGDVLVMVPNAREAAKLHESVAASAAYKANLQELLDHIQRHPERLLNPNSPEYQERQSLMGEVRVKGQQVMGGNSSDERAKLEGQIMGGSGAGFSPQVATATLRRLMGEADRVTNQKLNAAGVSPDGQPLAVGGGAADHNGALDWYRNPANAKDPNYAAVGASLKAQGLI